MKTKLTIVDRLNAGLGPKDPVTGCIEWTKGKFHFGHGQITYNGRPERTHRIAWMLKHGPIPDGMSVLHTCDNPPCCNDEHLFLGTQTDNMDDRTTKGRIPKGAKHGSAKLTDADVREIRRRVSIGETQQSLAKIYKVSQPVISSIKRRATWTHI